MKRPHNATTKRLITLNPNKRLRKWLPPAPGWNARRCLLETGSEGQWFTSVAVGKAHGVSREVLQYHFQRMLKLGQLERRRIEGRPDKPYWTRQDRAEAGPQPGMFVMRQKARWAYRLTYAGLAALEDLRAGKRDIIGRARSVYYATLQGWMPGRGPIRRKIVLQRLGRPSWGVLDWCRWNYGNPWPVGNGCWEWREWPVEVMFS